VAVFASSKTGLAQLLRTIPFVALNQRHFAVVAAAAFAVVLVLSFSIVRTTPLIPDGSVAVPPKLIFVRFVVVRLTWTFLPSS